jgi:hypothetical protein
MLTHPIGNGREVKPGDYVVIACEMEGSADLPDIARVDKIRSGLLNITWDVPPISPH